MTEKLDNAPNSHVDETDDRSALEYDAPGIDAIVTPEELEREVLYAGVGTLNQCP